ncbi:hypothetical protein J4558_20075 [Leptolyngbya sp. 15MV]|nr:hypothetical protein J4558_20075 [Leptolyngbya sp. 15MV]
MIVYCASDLMWATRIRATAEDVGVAARPVRSVDMLRARLADSPVRCLVLDPEAPEASLEMLKALRGHNGSPALDPDRRVRVVAFAPHVKTELMAHAAALGADRVLTRGAFDHTLADLLRAEGGATEPNPSM